ncbi:MAG: hypothetical protein INF41_04205 [Rhodospirillaceae bacterium]|jgi:hypothetical protein|nr:hypothetical protein [Rhodospirillaceae bacterium]
MQLKFTSNVDQLQKRLNLIATSQLPFVVSKALNATAVMAKAAVQKHFQDVLDRPTPFTQNAVTIRYATKSNLTAFVLVKDKQAAYLKRQEAGGVRTPTNTSGSGQKSYLMPLKANIDLNQYGNLPRNITKSLKGRKDVFAGTVNGHGGFFQRLPDGKLKMLIAFETNSTYKPVLGFKETVNKVAESTLNRNFKEAWATALGSFTG